jgi:gliding motility-associated-like protein
MPPAEHQVGTWYNGVVAGMDEERAGDGPEFDDPHLYNTRVTGLYYDEDGAGYSNAFTWFVKDTTTQCTGEATVQIISYHFLVDADEEKDNNFREVTKKGQSLPIKAHESPYYEGRWDRVTGNATPSPADKPSTTITGLSQGYNKIAYTATLKERKDRYVPPCKAVGYVTIAYRAFTVKAGDSLSICSDSVRLSAQMVPNAVSYWSAASGGSGSELGFDDRTNPTTMVRGLAKGRNVLLWNVIKNGYLAQDSVAIYNYSFDVDAGEDQHLCEDTTTLHASGPLHNPLLTANSYNWEGEWDHIGKLKYEGDNRKTANPHIYDIGNMTNKVVWHVTVTVDQEHLFTSDKTTLICRNEDTVNVTYYTAPKPEFEVDPNPAVHCTPYEFKFHNLTVKNNETDSVYYFWNFANQHTIKTSNRDTIIGRTFENTGRFDSIVPVWLVSNIVIPTGDVCHDTTSQSVTVWAKPLAKFSVAPETQEQDDGGKVNLYTTASEGVGVFYEWDYGDGQGKEFWKDASEFKSSDTYTYSTYGTFDIELKVSNKHCSDSLTKTIRIRPSKPRSNTGTSTYAGCVPQEFTLEQGVLYSDSIMWIIKRRDETDTLRKEAQFTVKTGENRPYTFNKPGIYEIEIKAKGPGSNGEYVHVRYDKGEIYPKPKADFETYPDTVRLPNIPLYTQNYSEGATEWYWNFGDGSDINRDKEPTYYYTKSGDYYVTLEVKNEYKCSDIKKNVHVRVEPEGLLRFPNAFTPDPSGPNGGVEVNRLHNDVFIPYPRNGVKAGTYILEIFNRYGEKIYESTDVNIGWDGYYRGKLCPQDVYVYKCKCTFENGKIFKEIGNVTLLR